MKCTHCKKQMDHVKPALPGYTIVHCYPCGIICRIYTATGIVVWTFSRYENKFSRTHSVKDNEMYSL